eukprot:1540359-Rhodomonas_salina.2
MRVVRELLRNPMSLGIPMREKTFSQWRPRPPERKPTVSSKAAQSQARNQESRIRSTKRGSVLRLP